MRNALWGFIIFVIVLSIPYLLERIKIEKSNTSYEITIPYEDVKALEQSGLTVYDVLRELKKAGVESLSITPLDLNDLEKMNVVQNFSKEELLKQYPNILVEELAKEDGIYIRIINPIHPVVKVIPEAIESNLNHMIKVHKYTVNNSEFLFVPYGTNDTKSQAISYDLEVVGLASSLGFSILPQLGTHFNDEDDEHPLFQQVTQERDRINHLVFRDDEIVGYSKTRENIEQMASRMKQWNINAVLFEHRKQKGFHELVEHLDTKMIRMHSLILGKGHEREVRHINRGGLAVNERNIQLLFVNLTDKEVNEGYRTPAEAMEAINGTTDFIEQLQHRIEKVPGVAEPFDTYSLPVWMKLLTVIAASVYLALVFLHFQIPYVLAITFFILGVSLFGIYLESNVLLKLLVLGIAVLSPIYAISSISKSLTQTKAGLSLLRGFGITLIGGWFVITLLYGWEYMVNIDGFRGVKILSILPVIIVTFMIVGVNWIKKPVTFGNMLMLVLIIGITYFYLGRTGNNEELIIPYELQFRQMLENVLGTRPRTKEFLIGIPFLTLGVYFVKQGFEWGKYFYIFGAIGFSSIIGTFTHLHTPLLVSINRTFIGMILGVGIGFILIILWNVFKKINHPLTKERLSAWRL